MHRLLYNLSNSSSQSNASYTYQRKALSQAYSGPLDRVNRLGDDESYGHTGCVNALSWAHDGELLISGGDDRTLRLWRRDSNVYSPYPYKETSIIQTGHTGNIFNAQLLPGSSRIATVSADRQVRVLDVERALAATPSAGRGLEFNEKESCSRVLKCHTGRTKRIVTEESSDVFLTVAEDGTVRQHDLRTPHRCYRTHVECPPPLVSLPHDLSALARSPLSPFLFVVAGESSYGYLFDRRQVGRTLQAEWGVPCTEENYVTCVRRFGKPQGISGIGRGVEHITGARMAQTNGHEVLLTYSADSVYLYSTLDQPQEAPTRPSSVIRPNSKRKKMDLSFGEVGSDMDWSLDEDDEETTSDAGFDSNSTTSHSALISSNLLGLNVPNEDTNRNDEGEREEDTTEEEENSPPVFGQPRLDKKLKMPIIMPQRQFSGHCNAETVKDVNFIGVEDEFIASGSDDGNFFLWEKDTGKIHGIYEGDGTVVNVIEGHPRLPLIACSGIDTTVKLFAPTEKPASYARMHNLERIVERNTSRTRVSASTQSSAFARLLWTYRMALRSSAEDSDE